MATRSGIAALSRAGVAEGTQVIAAPAGSGVTPASEASRPVEIERLQAGDLVVTHRGRLRRVVDVQAWAHQGPVVAIRRSGSPQVLRVAPSQLVATPPPVFPTARSGPSTARELRKALTASEDSLWRLLRDKGLRYKFRRQHPCGQWVIDFYCAELRLAVEVDGAVHDTPEQQARDKSRQEEIERFGVAFLRVRSSDVERRPDHVLAEIVAAAQERQTYVTREIVWVPAASLTGGARICCSRLDHMAIVSRFEVDDGVLPMRTLQVEEDGSYVCEVCIVRAACPLP